MNKRRSVGVTLIGVYLILTSAYIFLGTGMFHGPNVATAALVIGLLISGIGILMLKNWARYSAIILLLIFNISIIVNIVIFCKMNPLLFPKDQATLTVLLIMLPAGISLISKITINLICIFHLTRPKIKEQFKPLA